MGLLFKKPLHFKNERMTEPNETTPKSFFPFIVLNMAHNQNGNAIIADDLAKDCWSAFINSLFNKGNKVKIKISQGKAGLFLYL